jgi:hypothetical protein
VNERRAIWGAGIGLLMAVAVIGGIFIGRASDTVTHIMTFNTGVPTAFDPQPSLFCNTLHQNGGLQEMVDNIGQVSPAENTSLLMLRFVVEASPDKPTHTAMVGLYKEVLKGHPYSSTSETAINTVEGLNSCARYP